MQCTINEIAEKSGDEYGEIAGLMKMLVRRGLAKECGNRPNAPGVRGKPGKIYELDGAFDFVLFEEESNETAPLIPEIPAEMLPKIEKTAPELIMA